MGGRGNNGSRNSKEKLVFETKLYKSTTQQMKDIVTEVYEDMQNDFPMLSKSVEVNFTNGGGNEAIGDSIWLDGRLMKQLLNKDERLKDKDGDIYMRETVAHELVHVIQSRVGAIEGTQARNNGDFVQNRDYAEFSSKQILDTAINKYIANNPNSSTYEQIYKDLKKEYGLSTLDTDPSRRPAMERMAVAVERAYKARLTGKNKNSEIVQVGNYIMDELRRKK